MIFVGTESICLLDQVVSFHQFALSFGFSFRWSFARWCSSHSRVLFRASGFHYSNEAFLAKVHSAVVKNGIGSPGLGWCFSLSNSLDILAHFPFSHVPSPHFCPSSCSLLPGCPHRSRLRPRKYMHLKVMKKNNVFIRL